MFNDFRNDASAATGHKIKGDRAAFGGNRMKAEFIQGWLAERARASAPPTEGAAAAAMPPTTAAVALIPAAGAPA